uniref:ribonuclease H n=1 Tax=Micrurus spixii TaxID=129469 RepID=A0A2D4LMH6_9SAUR
MSQAYQQLPVDDTAADLQTIVTHRVRCRHLQFGVSVAPGLFQSLMERLLQGLPSVIPYFDDILISASDKPQLIQRVRGVLDHFRKAGLKLRKDKCTIATPQLEFLGYKVDTSGIHPTESKVRAIHDAPTPSNKTDLQSFLELLNFYASFLRHRASIAESLHRLLGKQTPWHWGPKEAHVFKAVKSLITYLIPEKNSYPVL